MNERIEQAQTTLVLDNPAASQAQPPSVEVIRAWLINKIGELLTIAPEEIDTQEPLTNYGLSSMSGVILSGDVEQWLGLALEPMVAWEYPTIDALAQYLADEMAKRAAAV
jgi:myxalamid-type polyketide synthase MxaB